MKYTLMHKNIAVADVEIDEAIGGISVIDNISAKEHLRSVLCIRFIIAKVLTVMH